MIFHLGELFCGPGGIGWGATHADIGNKEFGIVHQWANDLDESTCRTYTRNICPDAPESVYCEMVLENVVPEKCLFQYFTAERSQI